MEAQAADWQPHALLRAGRDAGRLPAGTRRLRAQHPPLLRGRWQGSRHPRCHARIGTAPRSTQAGRHAWHRSK